MFVPWLASSEVLGDRESDPERRDVRREPAFSKAFVCKAFSCVFLTSSVRRCLGLPLCTDASALVAANSCVGDSGLRLSFAASALAKAGLLRGVPASLQVVSLNMTEVWESTNVRRRPKRQLF